VAEAEKLTSCEFIVVLAPAASRYEGRATLIGVAGAVLTFVALYWVDVMWLGGTTDSLMLLTEGAAIGAILGVLFSRVSALRRTVIPRWRMTAAVDDAANATFTQENASLTKDRNAVLIFVSALEGEVRVMPDVGVAGKVDESEIGQIRAALANADSGDPTELVCDAVRKLGACCKDCFPLQNDDANELPDRPQIRLP
jgi:putative membrane protein